MIAEAESGIHRQTYAAVALAPLLGEVAELYDAAAEQRGIKLEVAVEGDPVARGDKDLLAMAFANLVDNALKYSGTGSRILIRAVENPFTASVVVADNGPGVPPAELSRVTERFYRAASARNQPGTGLGLAMVAAVVSAHEGTMTLEDARPGLRVRIELPRAVVDSLQMVS